jgi:hypothetical protein
MKRIRTETPAGEPSSTLPSYQIETRREESIMTAVVNLVSERQHRAAKDLAELREELLEKCCSAITELGDVAGFALVVWDSRGEMKSAYNAAQGPIGPPLVPTLVADALNRHVAVMLARNESDDSDIG